MSNTRIAADYRLAIIQVLILFWVMAIGAKLVRLQVSDHESLRARAERQQRAEIDLSPVRGIVYDRNGSELARSAEVKSLYASPAEITDPSAMADRLSKILDLDRDALYKRLTSTLVLAVVKRKLSKQEVAQVESLNLPGLRFVDEMKRFYLGGATGAHILGFVDIDERGMGGIEISYDRLIRGQAGKLSLDIDALKKSYNHAIQAPVPGANIALTIDTIIQHSVEKALAAAVGSSHASGGTAVVMRPDTGEILALASYPTFDPNNISDSSETERYNRAVEYSFEPGSIFKIVPYAAALEEGMIHPDTKIDCQGGQIRLPGRVVHDRPYGTLTAAQALAKSSNVAAIKIGQRLGNERLARYIKAFGFGSRTGIELPAESRGVFRDASKWGPTSIGSIPMGHEIAVTAVQAVAAFACIANGGLWVQPHLVSRVTTASGDVIEDHSPQSRRVISEDTAATLKTMLEGVVLQGTGKLAQINGYRAAGKTGTAQKIDEATGRYSSTRYVASFAGFAPVDNPEIVCIVSIDEPKGAHHGGDVAAPAFARIVADALHILGVGPEADVQSYIAAEDFQVYDISRAFEDSRPLAVEEASEQSPALDVAANANEGEVASNRFGSVVVPDLAGRGIREAVTLCAERGLKIEATGSGVVSGQSPPPGTLVAQQTICRVRLSKLIERPVGETAHKNKTDTADYKPSRGSGQPRGASARAN